jgi:hypothetical protein
MSLSDLQQAFALNVSLLIQRINDTGHGCTGGEWYRTPEQAAINAAKGIGIRNSLHCKRLAVDLNLFKDGVFLTDEEDHRQFGEWWEELDPRNRWGGRFKDGCHYSMTDDGKSA